MSAVSPVTALQTDSKLYEVAWRVGLGLALYLVKTFVVWLCLNLSPMSRCVSSRFMLVEALALVMLATVLFAL